MAGPEIKKEWTKAQKRCNSVEASFFFPALLENFFTVVNYSASCESRKGSHSSVRRKSFMWERIWNRVKCLHEKESDTSLLKRQPEDLPSVMAKRLEWDRLIKSVRVRPKYTDRLKTRLQLPQDWFATLHQWLPFHCFRTPIWSPWRLTKTLCIQHEVFYCPSEWIQNTVIITRIGSSVTKLFTITW